MSERRDVVGVLGGHPTTSEAETAIEWAGAASGPAAARAWASDAGFESVRVDWHGEWPEVVWWHRADPLPDVAAYESVADRVRDHRAAGGHLLLTGRAAAAVAALGVDEVAPDVVGHDGGRDPTGLLVKRVHADHDLFAWFDGLRVHTVPPGTGAPYARYERALPRDGEVLAATRVGAEDCPHHAGVVAWSHDGGAVLSVGTGVGFDGDSHEHGARDTLLRNALRLLVADDPLPARPRTGADLTALRDSLAADPHRPSWHVTPPANWLNDPNGVCRWNGRYHVFYQYNPGGPYHGCIHWGHAVSDDLVHWHDEPVALAPDPGGPDRDGCWSGCLVDDDGIPTVVYTGGDGRVQLPCLATSPDPGLRRWEKHGANPVIDDAPDALDVLETEHWRAEFRDHCVWREGETWHQLVGSGVADVGGAALHYASDDLVEWEFHGPFLVGDWAGAGEMWECPELLDLGDRSLLHVSDYAGVPYFLGRVADGAFERDPAAADGLLDHGDFYAPQSLRTDDGRVLTFGWLPEARPPEAQWDAGWSGALGLPRELSLGDDDSLRQRPARELSALRGAETRRRDLGVDEAGVPLEPAGRALELGLTVRLGDADAFELVVLEATDGHERTPVCWTRDGEVVVDREASSDDPRVAADRQAMPAPVAADDALSLRVFVDGSVVEVFADDREVLTSRVYPTSPDATGVRLRGVGGEAVVEEVAVWPLAGAWSPDR